MSGLHVFDADWARLLSLAIAAGRHQEWVTVAGDAYRSAFNAVRDRIGAECAKVDWAERWAAVEALPDDVRAAWVGRGYAGVGPLWEAIYERPDWTIEASRAGAAAERDAVLTAFSDLLPTTVRFEDIFEDSEWPALDSFQVRATWPRKFRQIGAAELPKRFAFAGWRRPGGDGEFYRPFCRDVRGEDVDVASGIAGAVTGGHALPVQSLSDMCWWKAEDFTPWAPASEPGSYGSDGRYRAGACWPQLTAMYFVAADCGDRWRGGYVYGRPE